MSFTPQCPTVAISAKPLIPHYQPVLPEPDYGLFKARPTDHAIYRYT